jgi:hypothetical protein
MNSGLAGRRGVRQRRFGLEQQDKGLPQLGRLDRCSLLAPHGRPAMTHVMQLWSNWQDLLWRFT